MRWFIIYFVVHGCVDVCGGSGLVIVGLYCLLLLLLLLLFFEFYLQDDLQFIVIWIVGLILWLFRIFYVRELYRFNDIKHVLWYQLGFWHSPVSQCEMKRKIQKKTVGRERRKNINKIFGVNL